MTYRYVTKKKRKFIGWAWSDLSCPAAKDGEKHKPHVHNSRLYLYGPYCCPGFPAKKVTRG